MARLERGPLPLAGFGMPEALPHLPYVPQNHPYGAPAQLHNPPGLAVPGRIDARIPPPLQFFQEPLGDRPPDDPMGLNPGDVRQCMPPYAPPFGPPLENANQNPGRAVGLAPESRQLNPHRVLQYHNQQAMPQMGPAMVYQNGPFREIIPYPQVGLPQVPDDVFLGMNPRPPQPEQNLGLIQPVADEPQPWIDGPELNPWALRGGNAHDPINISSPGSVADLMVGNHYVDEEYWGEDDGFPYDMDDDCSHQLPLDIEEDLVPGLNW